MNYIATNPPNQSTCRLRTRLSQEISLLSTSTNQSTCRLRTHLSQEIFSILSTSTNQSTCRLHTHLSQEISLLSTSTNLYMQVQEISLLSTSTSPLSRDFYTLDKHCQQALSPLSLSLSLSASNVGTSGSLNKEVFTE